MEQHSLPIARRTLLAAFLAGSPPIVVASKIDTEGALLGNLIALCLERQGVAVARRLQLGPTSILRAALLSGAIDIYPEYTGNGARFFHREGDAAWHEAGAAWRLVRLLDGGRNGVVWLAPALAENGWGIAVRRDFGPAVSLADLAQYINNGGRMRLAASVEFVEAADALPAFERAYGFRLRQDQLLMLAGGNTSATLRAASEGASGVNAAMAYGTDGAIDALGLRLLTDPARAEIVFQPAPVIRQAVLGRVPGIAAWLAPVFAALTLPVLRGLNARIAVEGEDAALVAARFLAGLKLPA